MRFEDLPYRPCVGVMLLNRDGLAFIGRRIEGPEYVDPRHAWQMPQGGIDQDEDPWLAALRELTGRDAAPTPEAWRKMLGVPGRNEL